MGDVYRLPQRCCQSTQLLLSHVYSTRPCLLSHDATGETWLENVRWRLWTNATQALICVETSSAWGDVAEDTNVLFSVWRRWPDASCPGGRCHPLQTLSARCNFYMFWCDCYIWYWLVSVPLFAAWFGDSQLFCCFSLIKFYVKFLQFSTIQQYLWSSKPVCVLHPLKNM